MTRLIDIELLYEIWTAKVNLSKFESIRDIAKDNIETIYRVVGKTDKFDVYCEKVLVNKNFGVDADTRGEFGIVFIGLEKRFKITRNIEKFHYNAIALESHYCDWKFITDRHLKKILEKSDAPK